jgi:hypothetical protein
VEGDWILVENDEDVGEGRLTDSGGVGDFGGSSGSGMSTSGIGECEGNTIDSETGEGIVDSVLSEGNGNAVDSELDKGNGNTKDSETSEADRDSDGVLSGNGLAPQKMTMRMASWKGATLGV